MKPADAFAPQPGTIFLDTATYGLPPRPTVDAMQEALRRWQAGTADWIADWDRPVEACRELFAELAGVNGADVSLLPTVSVGVGLMAASLQRGDVVVVPDDEFTSVLFPLLVARERGVTVREVPFAALPDEIHDGTTHVVFNLVQMQTGRRADLAAIVERARSVGARTLMDATQAVPFTDDGEDLTSVDVVLCAAYKHLLSPRGTAFMATSHAARAYLQPLAANWRAADQPYGRYFGGPLTLGEGGRAFDVSLAWIAWVGTLESMRLLVEWKRDGSLDSVRPLAERLSQHMGLPTTPSTLVCARLQDADATRAALADAGIRAAVRGTAIRLAPHVYTSEEEVDAAARVLGPLIDGAPG